MKWYSRLGLKTKFFLVTALIVIAICAGLFFFIERILRGYLQSEMQQQAGEITEGLKDQLSNFVDAGEVQATAERLLNESPQISRITIYQRLGNSWIPFIKAQNLDLPSNTALYSTAISRQSPFRYEFQSKGKEYWEFAYPIVRFGRVIGLTTVTLNFSQYKILVSALRTGTLVILVVGLIAMLISMNVYTEVTIRRPLAEIVAAMKQVKRSHFEVRVRPHSQDEIGMLTEDFNTMALALGEAQDEIMRQNRTLEQRVREATSELRARNLELFKAQDELRRANRLATVGQVAAMLAHDLGSPLSSISGHLQLMLEDPSRSADEQQRLQLLLTQVERLSDTIRNFLKNVTGLESHFQDCNLNALLDHLLQLTGPVLTERKIDPALEVDEQLPNLMADPNQLQQLFLNLFTNAIDAMKEGGQLKITTRYRSPERMVQVIVKDTGSGIGPEHLKNLFRPFFSTKEFGRGTGLGLAICEQIVKAHGGQIEVQSEEGKGTEFTILLPVTPSNTMRQDEKAEPTYSGR